MLANLELDVLGDLARDVGELYGVREAAGPLDERAGSAAAGPASSVIDLAPADGGVSWGVFVPLRLPVTVHFAQGDVVGFTRAIGLRGCAMDLPDLGKDVRYCQLDLHFPDEDMRLRARVKTTRIPICVARFETMASESRERLYQTISEFADIPVYERAPRAPISLNVLVRDGDEAWKTLSVNISKSGVLVCGPRAPEVGSTCLLRLYLGGLSFDTPAKVVRAEKDLVAFHFDELGEARDRALEQYLLAAGAIQLGSATAKDEAGDEEGPLLP